MLPASTRRLVHYTQDLFKRIRLCSVWLCVPPGDLYGGSVRHTFRVPGFPWDKTRERGWNTATALIVALSLVRTSAKQMSHRNRSTDAHRTMLVKIVSLGRNKSYFPSLLYYLTRVMRETWEISIRLGTRIGLSSHEMRNMPVYLKIRVTFYRFIIWQI